MKKFMFMLITACFFIISAADKQVDDIKVILDKMDRVYRSDTSEFELEMEIIAYEPVRAIAKGVVATPQQATEIHAFIRKIMKERYNREDTVILYGRSVKPDNVKGLVLKSSC